MRLITSQNDTAPKPWRDEQGEILVNDVSDDTYHDVMEVLNEQGAINYSRERTKSD